jgi:hypothetical protein
MMPSPIHQLASVPMRSSRMESLEEGRKSKVTCRNKSKRLLASDPTITLSVLEGSLFEVDKAVLSAISPIYRSMFDDAKDDGQVLELQDSASAWRLCWMCSTSQRSARLYRFLLLQKRLNCARSMA